MYNSLTADGVSLLAITVYTPQVTSAYAVFGPFVSQVVEKTVMPE